MAFPFSDKFVHIVALFVMQGMNDIYIWGSPPTGLHFGFTTLEKI